MKILLTSLWLGIGVLAYGQNTVEATGSWCNNDLVLITSLADDASIVHWKKDGVVIEGETKSSLPVIEYGKGVYEVAILQGGETQTLSEDLSEVTGPVANFEAKNYLAAAVTFFIDQSVSDEEITTWSWDFGNGETSAEQNPKVMFSEQKTYTITLTTTTASGCTHTIKREHKWSYE